MTSIYIEAKLKKKIQLKFEIKIQFCAIYLNLREDYT